MKKNSFFWMKKKNFLWIFVVLAAILLFFFMSRNLEGFYIGACGKDSDCSSYSASNTCPIGQKLGCNTNFNSCSCKPSSSTSGSTSSTTSGSGPSPTVATTSGSGPASSYTKKTPPKTCPSGQRLVNGSCQAINW